MLKRYILIIVILFSVANVFSQSVNNTLYFLENAPQSNKLNPANTPEYKVWVGFPGLSSIYLNYSNNSFAIEDILRKGEGNYKDSVIVDINTFHDALKNNNRISLSNEITIFALGFKVKQSYFTLDISNKSDMMFGFSKDFVTFFKDGNATHLGETFDLGDLQMNGMSYNQVALGYAREINEKLTVGGKLKFLMGIANVDMTDSQMSIYTNEDATLMRLRSKQHIRVSMPLNVYQDEDGFTDLAETEFNDDNIDGSFLSGTKNTGFGIDLGATYKVNDKLTLSASLLDLGMIKWKNETYEFYQDAFFDWEGADWSQSGNSNAPGFKDPGDVLEDLVDSLSDQFSFRDRSKAYSTPLNAKFYLGGTYRLKDWITLGALTRTQFHYGQISSSLSLSANTRVCRNVSASLSYSILNNSFTNLGFGLTAKLGCMQMYMVTDNLMAGNFTGTQTVNFRFGINLLFGHKGKNKTTEKEEQTDDYSAIREL